MVSENIFYKYILILTTLASLRSCICHSEIQSSINLITDLIKGEDDKLLVASTLDGSLIGIDKRAGDIRWRLKNEPMVKVPNHRKNSLSAVFLPNPKDGSLYLLNTAESKILKKLPFSIQQLVASSPCKSNDGIFYTGKKIDKWLSVDWKTGKKTSILSFDHQEKTCPVSGSDSLFIGMTEYSIMMYDMLRENRQWNITFFDYSSSIMTPEELSDYGYVHLSGSGSGRVRTLIRGSGKVVWEKDYGSPLVGLYIRRGQDILSLPFTSISEQTLDSLPFLQHSEKLLATLYIGEHEHGLYALPSLAGRDLPLLPNKDSLPRLMIEGPNDTNEIIIRGHYHMPDTSKTQLRITGRSDPILFLNKSETVKTKRNSLKKVDASSQTQEAQGGFPENRVLSFMVGGLAVAVIVMFLHFRAQVRDIQLSSQGSSQGSVNQGIIQESQQGVVVIGKISFNAQHIIGKGCEGTFVFKGEFDGRKVAVKRLLPDCFTVADREVCLLRESDAHQNVVRYYCMEQDSQFRYIALELCSSTLQDYVEKRIHNDDIPPICILKQASSGLGHLHSLNIVHRDIKPQNILLCWSGGSSNEMRAMISDFGLCKKLQNGRVSFSRKSGITGTDGWIAPEMIESNGRTMCAVDIFSMGCVFYYVLTNGKHPFGEPLRRQANILSGDYRLDLFEDLMWKALIEKMISSNPVERPSIQVVLKYPTFWGKAYILSFLQEVSDRLEKESVCQGGNLERLERGGWEVIKSGGGDWRKMIHPELSSDLSKYRSYRGDSLRDLLRALRNKKHHYRELSLEIQSAMGSNSESYVSYWLSSFPLLLYHTWTSMQFLRSEPAFSCYYDASFLFPSVESKVLPSWFQENDQSIIWPLLNHLIF